MKKYNAILTRMMPVVKEGRIVQEPESIEVVVMAKIDNYAMVRRKGCYPFVCRAKDLK